MFFITTISVKFFSNFYRSWICTWLERILVSRQRSYDKDELWSRSGLASNVNKRHESEQT